MKSPEKAKACKHHTIVSVNIKIQLFHAMIFLSILCLLKVFCWVLGLNVLRQRRTSATITRAIRSGL